MRFALTFIIALLISMTACESPDSLEAVAGVEGTVNLDPVWPDSLAAAAVLVFDLDLELDSLTEADYPVIDHFITYSDPISPGISSANYFIQLEPGGYLLMVIGLLVDPAQLLANEDMLNEIQNYIVVPEKTLPRGILIREKQINEQTDWFVQF